MQLTQQLQPLGLLSQFETHRYKKGCVYCCMLLCEYCRCCCYSMLLLRMLCCYFIAFVRYFSLLFCLLFFVCYVFCCCDGCCIFMAVAVVVVVIVVVVVVIVVVVVVMWLLCFTDFFLQLYPTLNNTAKVSSAVSNSTSLQQIFAKNNVTVSFVTATQGVLLCVCVIVLLCVLLLLCSLLCAIPHHYTKFLEKKCKC